ncbi:MAG: VanZ family protein [Anaerohalosphaeraceae bacterium]|nr:VanZ family protein [Anaerohalosphaeraceae bacterium]
MISSKEHKILRVLLVVFWAGMFFVTHIPVPGWTRKMAMSDKTMHYIAFFALSVLLWLAADFSAKVNWRKAKIWKFLAVICGYAIIDEVLQGVMGRSADRYDFLADMAGAIAAFLMLTFLTGFHSVIVLASLAVFVLPYIVNSGLIPAGTVFEVLIYMTFFFGIGCCWMVYMFRFFKLKMAPWEVVLSSGLFAFFTLNVVRFYALWKDKPFSGWAFWGGTAGVILVAAAAMVFFKIKERKNN